MAQALVSAILQQLATFTIQNAEQELRSLTGVDEDIRELERNLRAIHVLLEDAEEKQMMEGSVKLWLNRVKEASYDLEDILDEWNTAPSLIWETTLKRKVLSFISCYFFPQVSRRHNIAAKIQKVKKELDKIAKDKDRYLLATREIKQASRFESTSFVDVSKLHGRDEVKKEIVTTLLSENSMQTISIVGMGGIGKTALAQLIYNDVQVQAHFSKIIWVCVSDFFDQYKVALAILEGFGQNSVNLPNPISLQSVLNKICEQIKKEKFFLVLDDVWTDQDANWEPFKAIFREGMSGSKILVTTRKESVAVGMESFRKFYLEEFPDEVCWLILRQVAFVGKDKELCKSLEDVGKEIAKKCKGLPLAAKTLGGLLREKTSKIEWQNVLNSELWELNSAHENIYKPLLLSYFDLPWMIRPCFVYCAIFPKDYELRKYELITHWMAQGYLNSDVNEELELLGEEYFNYLASRSLFQDFGRDGSGSISKCKMHDIVHDFVKWFCPDEIAEKEVDVGMLHLFSIKGRHLNLIIHTQHHFDIPVNGLEKLRSFVSRGPFHGPTNEGLRNVVNDAKGLRLLEVSCMRELAVPKEIGRLIHLRFLELSSIYLERLPEEVCELRNLQFLNVSDCWSLGKLPDGIGKLINLRHLISWRCSLKYYPKGIARLASLRKLQPVIAKASKDSKIFSIGDLENLDLLRGLLPITVVGTTLDMKEVKRAQFQKKIHLQELRITLEVRTAEKDFRQALNAPPNVSIGINYRLRDELLLKRVRKISRKWSFKSLKFSPIMD